MKLCDFTNKLIISQFTYYFKGKGQVYGAVTQVAGFPQLRSGFDQKSSHVGFVVNIMALGYVFYEYFSSSANSRPPKCSVFITRYQVN